ncbi:hypothetical protein [Persephonella sp.]
MGKVDITLRDVVQEIPQRFIKILTGKSGVRLLDTSLPEVKDRRVDLLVELEDKSIFHLEIQTTNDPNMPIRVLEYFVLLLFKYPDREILQTVLYIGEKPLKMKNFVKKQNIDFSFNLKDIKEIKCEELIKSEDPMDKILAVLCDVRNPDKLFDEIGRILIDLPETKRKDYMKKLLNLLSYRPKLMIQFEKTLKEAKMPLTIDEETLKKNPLYKKGKKEGFEEGLEKGLEKGLIEAKKEAVINLYKELKLPPEKISKVLKIPLSSVKKFLKEIKD